MYLAVALIAELRGGAWRRAAGDADDPAQCDPVPGLHGRLALLLSCLVALALRAMARRCGERCEPHVNPM